MYNNIIKILEEKQNGGSITTDFVSMCQSIIGDIDSQVKEQDAFALESLISELNLENEIMCTVEDLTLFLKDIG